MRRRPEAPDEHFTPSRPVTRVAPMASEYDPAEFVDSDFQAARRSAAAPSQPSSPFATVTNRAPTREELESRVTDMQSKLTELKKAQQDLERERADIEET